MTCPVKNCGLSFHLGCAWEADDQAIFYYEVYHVNVMDQIIFYEFRLN
jgi:hypothetical protein